MKRFLQIAHRWLGLLLGAQIILWMASGVVMSWLAIGLVRGENTAGLDYPPSLTATSYASPGGVIAQVERASEVTLRDFLGKPVYETSGAEGSALFDANTGEQISPLDAKTARRAAKADYIGQGELVRVVLLNNTPGEFRGDTPVWRAEFDDGAGTRLYISPQTGRTLARRNKYWRFYDFFWMLHIMDYGERSNFNNPLIRTASATGLAFALTGLGLVIVRVRSGRYRDDVKRRTRTERR